MLKLFWITSEERAVGDETTSRSVSGKHILDAACTYRNQRHSEGDESPTKTYYIWEQGTDAVKKVEVMMERTVRFTASSSLDYSCNAGRRDGKH